MRRFVRKTNLEEIKETTKRMALIMSPKETMLQIAIHPFVDNMYWYEKQFYKKCPMDECYLGDDKIYHEWYENFCSKVDKAEDLTRVYMFWRDPWKLTFMKYCGKYLSAKDYAELLADAWVTEENPNMDVNVSRKEAIKMFNSCDKKLLMEKEDYEYYMNLPDEITIWRGVGYHRIDLGLSWTDDEDKAKWFMNRWKSSDKYNTRQLLQVTTNKKNVIAYFNTRDEKEILLDVFAVKDKIKRII